MKKKIIAMVAAVMLCSAGSAFAAASEGSKLLCTAAFLKLAGEGYEIDYADADDLTTSQVKRYSGNREADVTYAAVGVAVEDETKIRVKVFDENEKLIEEDTDVRMAVASHTPKWTGKFAYTVDVYKNTDFCFGILTK
ncbi:hypothetical protein KI811_14675 [Geobacter hydrogenophilus]|uniref:Uncharacterized protein n=1 Tax=Geobacter hydrogenophilus TaxID=40983 RepID=A0A9W6FXY9_9BACT|nr:hypothetical protein [Geobacter hydrogenophilus]MBT0895055.1 hypothetical protein [Geobacter hydrogenophilus]GLI36879.1 hypothetical protein GHYDROH2_03800 [Geobacter hydrogenophilus]